MGENKFDFNETDLKINSGIISKNIRGRHEPIYSFHTHLQGSPLDIPGATPKTSSQAFHLLHLLSTSYV